MTDAQIDQWAALLGEDSDLIKEVRRLGAKLRSYAKRDLYRAMSDISETCWAAGWLIGTEFTLWEMVRGGDRRWGLGTVTEDEIEELRILCDDAGGWWAWSRDDDPMESGAVFLSMPLWERAFKAGPDDSGHVRAEFIAEARALSPRSENRT